MEPITYVKRGSENVAEIFCKELEETTRKIYERFQVDAPMIFNDEAKKLFNEQNECYACGETFSDEKCLKKVRDHCHFTGKFRGALHSKCNLRLRKAKTIPVFFHNLKGYNSHLFVKHLADTEGSVNCIPHNEEKYITFAKNVLVGTKENKDGSESDIFVKLKFLDTMHFMSSSLEKLDNNLEPKQFKHTSKYFQGDRLDLMLKKGIYPYEYMDSQKKLSETQFPSKNFILRSPVQESPTRITSTHKKFGELSNVKPLQTTLSFISSRTSFFSPTSLKISSTSLSKSMVSIRRTTSRHRVLPLTLC